MNLSHGTARTVLGEITIFVEDGFIVAVDWGRPPPGASSPILDAAFSQLSEYLDGKRQTFDLPLKPQGTAFQKRCWTALLDIPCGETKTYGEIVSVAGGSPRAVGMACGANPIPIFIPCHRIVAASGKLGGYSAGSGVETKKLLLQIEQSAAT